MLTLLSTCPLEAGNPATSNPSSSSPSMSSPSTKSPTTNTYAWGYRLKPGQKFLIAKALSMRIVGKEQDVTIDEMFGITVDSSATNGDIFLTLRGQSSSTDPESEVIRAANGSLNGPTPLSDGSTAFIRINLFGEFISGRFQNPPTMIQEISGIKPSQLRNDSNARSRMRTMEQKLLRSLTQDLLPEVPHDSTRTIASHWQSTPALCMSLQTILADTAKVSQLTADSNSTCNYIVAQSSFYGKEACLSINGRPTHPYTPTQSIDIGCARLQHEDSYIRQRDGVPVYREVAIIGESAQSGRFASTIRYTLKTP